jgi:sulfite reductase (ferredoxin)
MSKPTPATPDRKKPLAQAKPSLQKKLSPVEIFKAESHYLRGSIPEELVDGKPHFGKASIQLLKHHGAYQQDNRDERAAAKKAGKPDGKAYSFMVRTAIPGGKLTSKQLLAELDMCDEMGNSTLRITTRQGLQLHGVLKDDLKKVIRRIHQVQLTTLAACGDVERNVMCSPVPYRNDPVYDQMQALADQLAIHLRPRTKAYYELWLKDEATGEKRLAGRGEEGTHDQDEVEPLYGPTYLPRKFKIGIGLPGDNSADVYSHDLGLLAVCENWSIVGYNVLVGGGFGTTPSAKKTFPTIAQPMCLVSPTQVLDVVTAVIRVQRDYGNRGDRKVARMRYLIHHWGLDRFKQKVQQYYGGELAPPRLLEVFHFNDGLGWHPQGDGGWFYGLNVENGRIQDEGACRLKTALREICRTFNGPLRLTPHQSLLFCDLRESDHARLVEILQRSGVPLSEEISKARRWSMACPALPTCGLAVTESERILPDMISRLETELERLGLADEVFTTRMTGCPNGCARPYNADIGLVGKMKGKYTLFLGGCTRGDRLNFIYQDKVPADEVVPKLVSLFRYFRDAREPGETFGDFCYRKGSGDLLAHCGEG